MLPPTAQANPAPSLRRCVPGKGRCLPTPRPTRALASGIAAKNLPVQLVKPLVVIPMDLQQHLRAAAE
jgi:hypothetical protein